jgi:hypothetical protein
VLLSGFVNALMPLPKCLSLVEASVYRWAAEQWRLGRGIRAPPLEVERAQYVIYWQSKFETLDTLVRKHRFALSTPDCCF